MKQKEYSPFQKVLLNYFLRPVVKPVIKAYERQKHYTLTQNMVIIAIGSLPLIGAYYLVTSLWDSSVGWMIMDCCQDGIAISLKKSKD